MKPFKDQDTPSFRRELSDAVNDKEPFAQRGIPSVVHAIAEKYGRNIHCLSPLYPSDPHFTTINCHCHALGLDSSNVFREIAKSPESNFIDSLIESNLLVLRPDAIQERDLVLYRNKKQITHSGLVFPTEIESKWGTGAIYRHSLYAVPCSYGSLVSYYAPPELAAVETSYRKWCESKSPKPPLDPPAED